MTELTLSCVDKVQTTSLVSPLNAEIFRGT